MSVGPLRIQGNRGSLAALIESRLGELERELVRRGSLLFSGFEPLTPGGFRSALGHLVGTFLESQGEHTAVSGQPQVFNPVRYSPERLLLWHNENTFNTRWPEIIAFGCLRPADRGGESLLVDSRELIRALDPQIVNEFKRRRLQYIRRMGLGIDRDWRHILGAETRAQAEARCREQALEFRWLGANVLETTAVRDATAFHPASGEECWFNQMQHWHQRCLDPDVQRDLVAVLGEQNLPRDCRFGDGGLIPDSMVDHILATYRALEHAVACRKGEVLVLDNLAVAHGRGAFEGPREILVAMGLRRKKAGVHS